MTRLETIVGAISSIENVTITLPFEQNREVIVGSIQVTLASHTMSFRVEVQGQYPLQYHGSESIQFFNEQLKEYNHVMKNGFICIHTSHSPDLIEKLHFDLKSLKEWMARFYINPESEAHYEHIVVPAKNNNIYWFTEVGHEFRKNEFGKVKYSRLSKTLIGADSTTLIVKSFETDRGLVRCKWSSTYQQLLDQDAIFIFVEDPPVTSKKFAIENWLEFVSIFPPDFLGYMYNFQRQRGKVEFPLLVGYRIPESEIHWQSIIVKPNDPPTSGEKIPGTKKYLVKLKDKPINWSHTENCSYQYFYGRGALNKHLTDSNILVIGVGAVGSMLARSLVRGGCKRIGLADHDRKNAGNVCRSEYAFKTGVTTKVLELAESLTSISPFVEVATQEILMDGAKVFLNHDEHFESVRKLLDQYDLVFDCSTDNDVAYLLEKYSIRAQLLNISITNQAKELICATSPNLYEWLIAISKRLSLNEQDLYNPTGCWNPTFKASYNDVSVLVQFALKQINNTFENDIPLRNFYLSTTIQASEFNIKLNQF